MMILLLFDMIWTKLNKLRSISLRFLLAAITISQMNSSYFCIITNTLKLLMRGTNLKSITQLPTRRILAKSKMIPINLSKSLTGPMRAVHRTNSSIKLRMCSRLSPSPPNQLKNSMKIKRGSSRHNTILSNTALSLLSSFEK
jgi:hypothetical protein